MGTRHLVGVVVDGDFKIAQYGQWDGYPAGQGATVLDFLTKDFDRDLFTERVRALRWATEEDFDRINKELDLPEDGWMNMEQANRWKSAYPGLSRDAGAEILGMVRDGSVTMVADNRDFAYDSLFCEWAYIIDLDKGTLEVYKGFNQEVPKAGRWAGDERHTDGGAGAYYAINLAKTYSLDNLPDVQELVEDVEEDEEHID